MKILKRHWIGIIIGIVIFAIDILFLYGQKSFYFLLGVAVLITISPFVASAIIEIGREKEKEQMFLEFTRNLVENVKAGTPISKSIIQMRNKEFGSLTPHVQKLANQIALGISVKQAFNVFASDINNKVISRSIALITEAEESGGEISLILESTAKSVSEIEDIKKERRSSTYNLVVQGYIIFIIFLVIMLVIQTQFIPLMLETLAGAGVGAELGGFIRPSVPTDLVETLGNLFVVLIIIQGFFAGLVIGKLSEGRIRDGIKHSAIITAFAYLVTFGIKIFI
ncbi:MAG: type II secretion system F family protein [Candidatus Pacearchaeota archaeon]